VKIKVHIKAKQTVTYDQSIEMEEEAFEKLKQKLEDADVIISLPTELSEEIEELLDLQEVMDAAPLEDVEIEKEA
jgi:signal recognition particle GTPase